MFKHKELREMLALLKELDVPFYLQAGFALHLHGLEGEIDDYDIRVFCNDVSYIERYIKSRGDYKTTIHSQRRFSEGVYMNDCLEVWMGQKCFDICGTMVALCDFGEFTFPYNESLFAECKTVRCRGQNLPTASLEGLLLYYLVLRRGARDGKNDEKRIRDIIDSTSFDPEVFRQLIAQTPYYETLLSLFGAYEASDTLISKKPLGVPMSQELSELLT